MQYLQCNSIYPQHCSSLLSTCDDEGDEHPTLSHADPLPVTKETVLADYPPFMRTLVSVLYYIKYEICTCLYSNKEIKLSRQYCICTMRRDNRLKTS